VDDPVLASGEAWYAWSYDADLIGAVDGSTDPVGSHSFGYDKYGNPSNATRTWTDGA
jgi:YD repeat-containing protein